MVELAQATLDGIPQQAATVKEVVVRTMPPELPSMQESTGSSQA
jgi:hypothetical protein